MHDEIILQISDHLRRAESFQKDSKGFRLSKRVTQFIQLNEFATKHESVSEDVGFSFVFALDSINCESFCTSKTH